VSSRHQGIGMTSQRTRDRMVARIREQGVTDESVLAVMASLPRHLFVDEALASRAYEDTALPIGHRQTISQPYIVAAMSEALLAAGNVKKVLEVGTGSGYQAAVLANLVDEVYSVERIKELMNQARKRFQELKLNNIRLKYSDGSWGWKYHAPYDGIIVTAAPHAVPTELCQQLRIGGRMIIPIGDQGSQSLQCITRKEDEFEVETLNQVSFVPLLGGTT